MQIKRDVPTSPTVRMNTLAQQKKAAGEVVYNFAAGDPMVPNHPAILAGAKKGLAQEFLPYPPIPGLPRLRQLAAEWVNQKYGCHFLEKNVIVTCGGKLALFSALHALLAPGDEVLLCAPYWPSFFDLVNLCAGTPKVIPARRDTWKLTPEDLSRNASPKTRVLILNNANNPSGALYTREEISAILQVAKEKNLIVISDEVYSETCYDGAPFISCGSFVEHQERVAVVQSCSKNFGMTGWRVGFLLGPENLIRAANSLEGQTTTGTALVCQWAAIGALEHAQEVTEYIRSTLRTRRDLFMRKLQELFGHKPPIPPSAIYTCLPLTFFGVTQETSFPFCERILNEASVSIVPGVAFGVEGYVRMSFSEVPEVLEKGLEALARACQK